MFDNSQVSEVRPMKPAPRIEGCALVEMKKLTDEKTGASSVTFKFTGPAGTELTHREFEPSKVINNKPLTDEEFKKNVSLVHSRIAHITRAFISEELFLKIKVNPNLPFREMWNEYLKMTAQALKVDANGRVGAAVNQPCALKVVYTQNKGKWYSGLPKVPPFISTANHPKEFDINTQYDKFEIEKISPDAENNSGGGGGFASTSTPNQEAGFGAAAATNHESGF